ncbi:hypothetical protein ACXZ65_38100 [Streptomyces aculeolatus]
MQTTIRLPVADLDGQLGAFCRTYQWDRRTMQALPRVDSSEGTDTDGESPYAG